MVDKLREVELNPTAIKSGSQTTATIVYEADQDGELSIDCSSAFSVTPTSAPLRATNGARTVPLRLTVTRLSGPPPHRCLLTFTFNNSIRKHLEVT